jgi:Ni/Co efflux regulator RcnB
MKNVKTLSSVLLVAALAVPAIAMAQDRDDHRDQHQTVPQRADQGRGAGPDHAWHKGDAIPAAYRGQRYEVTDWRSHHLSAPPSGYHWVQVNGDFVLAAVATGVIADMLLSN